MIVKWWLCSCRKQLKMYDLGQICSACSCHVLVYWASHSQKPNDFGGFYAHGCVSYCVNLQQLNVSMPNPLSRASSIRRMSVTDADWKGEGSGQDVNRGLFDNFDDSNLEYDELDGIAPLPLHILLSASDPSSVEREKTSEMQQVTRFMMKIVKSSLYHKDWIVHKKEMSSNLR